MYNVDIKNRVHFFLIILSFLFSFSLFLLVFFLFLLSSVFLFFFLFFSFSVFCFSQKRIHFKFTDSIICNVCTLKLILHISKNTIKGLMRETFNDIKIKNKKKEDMSLKLTLLDCSEEFLLTSCLLLILAGSESGVRRSQQSCDQRGLPARWQSPDLQRRERHQHPAVGCCVGGARILWTTSTSPPPPSLCLLDIWKQNLARRHADVTLNENACRKWVWPCGDHAAHSQHAACLCLVRVHFNRL